MGVIKSDEGFDITFISFFLYMDLVGGESSGAHVYHCALTMHPADLSHIIILSVILTFVRKIKDAKARSAIPIVLTGHRNLFKHFVSKE